MAKRHVVFITITFDPEPGALRGLPLARRLVKSGEYDVTVITAIPWYPLGRFYPGYRLRAWQWEHVDGVAILRVPLVPSHDRSALRRVVTYCSFAVSAALCGVMLVRKADVIYHVDNLPTTGLVACLYRQVWGAPIVQHIGDLWPDSFSSAGMVGSRGVTELMTRVLHSVQAFIYSRNSAITVITEGFRSILASRGVPREKVHVLPNWADEDRFSPVAADRGALARFGLGETFNVVYAGNVGVMQALHVLLDAAPLLHDLGRVRLVVIGDGPKLDELRRRAEGSGLTNVVFLGRLDVDAMAAINAAADALLIHLKDEPFLHTTVPSKTQVSMLAGRPILMGARGDAADLVEAAGAGLVFTPEDGKSLASAVRLMATIPRADLDAMGQRGSAYYKQHLSMSHGVQVMDSLFRTTAGATA